MLKRCDASFQLQHYTLTSFLENIAIHLNRVEPQLYLSIMSCKNPLLIGLKKQSHVLLHRAGRDTLEVCLRILFQFQASTYISCFENMLVQSRFWQKCWVLPAKSEHPVLDQNITDEAQARSYISIQSYQKCFGSVIQMCGIIANAILYLQLLP